MSPPTDVLVDMDPVHGVAIPADGASIPAPAVDDLGDREIRRALLARLEQLHAADDDTVVLQELGLRRRRVRADVAVVNGILHGYEIKSDRDTLRRLAGQTIVYGEIFDRVTLVAGRSQLVASLRHVPDWWEVVEARRDSGHVTFHVHREGAANPARCGRALAELLWADTALQLLDALGAARGVRSKPRRQVWDRIAEVCSVDEVADAVRRALKARPARGCRPTSA